MSTVRYLSAIRMSFIISIINNAWINIEGVWIIERGMSQSVTGAEVLILKIDYNVQNNRTEQELLQKPLRGAPVTL
jgi:hypothetical protein